jgi:hypothetical protein
MKTRRLEERGLTATLILAGLLCSGSLATAADSGYSVVLKTETRELEILHQGRRLLVYAFATSQFKPYVRELYTLDGVNVLRDAPADHLHHHALMYAIKANDLNFWEEPKGAGHQKPLNQLTRDVKKDARGRTEASFSQTIHWITEDQAALADTTPVALLIEQRTITVSVDEPSQEVALHWLSDFEVGSGTPRVVLTGAPYHGLGLRFPAEFDRVAQRLNSENLAYAEGGRDQVMPGKWAATAHTVGGRLYTIAMFQHPANAGKPRFFSMVNPFTYMSATQGLDETPLEYKSGERFRVQHLVTVSPGRKTNESLDRRYQRWATP